MSITNFDRVNHLSLGTDTDRAVPPTRSNVSRT
jgi:hypothetical protein